MIYLSGLFDFHESDHLSISTGRQQLLLNSAALVRLGAPAIYLLSEKRWFKIPIISVHFRVGSVYYRYAHGSRAKEDSSRRKRHKRSDDPLRTSRRRGKSSSRSWRRSGRSVSVKARHSHR